MMDKGKMGEEELLLLWYPRCSTCQKAHKWLAAQGISVKLRDIKEANPTAEELKAWHARSGIPLKRFFNTSGMKYRELGLKDKLSTMSDEEQYALLGTDGMLVKRPLLIGADFVCAGFKEEEWERERNA